jgi:RNA polymerase sigma factor (sigma-70 family)
MGATTDATMLIATALLERPTVEILAGADAQDQELVARLRAGDEEAFRGLFDRYASTAKALALRIVRQTHLAEEIVQEVFLAVWRSPEGYDGARGSVRSWLMGMVHHRAVDAVRREEAHRRRADSVAAEARDETVDHADDVVEAIGRPEERRVVRAALDELPAEQREVLELMYFDGLTQTQVAEKVGLPLGTVKSRTLLGMRRMRSALGGWER